VRRLGAAFDGPARRPAPNLENDENRGYGYTAACETRNRFATPLEGESSLALKSGVELPHCHGVAER
jgi:hypothetical protein